MEPVSRLQKLEEIPYPLPPWKMTGQAWMGYFKSDAPIQLPAGLHHVLPPRSVIVAVIRYQEGTLCYDELIFGTLVRIGVWVDAAFGDCPKTWQSLPGRIPPSA